MNFIEQTPAIDGIFVFKLQGIFNERNLDLIKEIGLISASGKPKIVFNLSEITRLDISGLGTLISCLAIAQKNQGGVFLSAIPRPIVWIFRTLDLNEIFQLFSSDEQAINHFRR
ncbi:MAG TPA: STAS domain-containing protein [bacterium]|nr:STAS domain-containing protein [bacterium]HPL95620.1 STAS domain-containing protein [bacterium]